MNEYKIVYAKAIAQILADNTDDMREIIERAKIENPTTRNKERIAAIYKISGIIEQLFNLREGIEQL